MAAAAAAVAAAWALAFAELVREAPSSLFFSPAAEGLTCALVGRLLVYFRECFERYELTLAGS